MYKLSSWSRDSRDKMECSKEIPIVVSVHSKIPYSIYSRMTIYI